MFSQSAVFDDVNQHAHSLQNWPQEYAQLSSGKFEGFLEDIQLDSVRVFRERMKQSVVQNTHTPTGKISLMIPHHMDASDTSALVHLANLNRQLARLFRYKTFLFRCRTNH